MKTAMQELIEHIESNEIVYNKDLILKLKELLEKEKQQIEIAFDLGRDEVTSVFIIDGEDYYNKSYNQNK